VRRGEIGMDDGVTQAGDGLFFFHHRIGIDDRRSLR
jgi:hypothetical protein